MNPLDVSPAEVLRQRGLWVGVLPPLAFMAVRWGVGTAGAMDRLALLVGNLLVYLHLLRRR